MSSLSSNDGNPNQSPPMQLKMPNLRNRNLKLAPDLSDDRPDKAALLLERMHIPKQQINLQDPSKHAFRP